MGERTDMRACKVCCWVTLYLVLYSFSPRHWLAVHMKMAKMVTTAPENGHVGDILLDVMAPFRARSPLDSARAEYVQLDLLDLAAIQLMGGSTSSTSLQSSLYKNWSRDCSVCR